MKNLIIVYGMLLCSLGLHAQNTPITRADYQQAARFSPNNLNRMVFSTRVDPHWLKSGSGFWYSYKTTDGISYYLVNPQNRSKRSLFDNDQLAADMSRLTGDPFDRQNLDISNLEFIEGDRKVRFEVKSKLLEVEEEDDDDEDEQRGQEQEGDKDKKSKKKKMVKKTWFFEYTISSGKLILLEDYKKPKKDKDWANFSPDQTIVLYGRNHNLYWMDIENYQKALKDEKDSTIVENQLTTDGEKYFDYTSREWGKTDDEIEKDKDKRKAVNVAWAPNSRKFAMIKSDSRHLKDLWVINSVAKGRPTLETYKYQMPGEKENPKSELHVFDLDKNSQVKIETDNFPDQSLRIFYASNAKKNRDDKRRSFKWLSGTSDKVYFSRISRDLKRVDLCVADVETGGVEVLIEERLNIYVDEATPGLVNNGKEIIQWSERDGWAHFYLYDENGNLKNQITSGPFHCEDIEGIDEKNRVLYFTANGREKGEDPYYSHLYKVNFDGSGLKLLNRGDFTHQTSLNDENTFFVNNFSRVNTTPQTDLYSSNGSKIMTLETADLSLLFAAGYKFPEPFKVKAGDGITDLYGVMYKPFDFDSTKLYPLIEYVYPGPQTEAVNKSFSASMNRTDRMAQLGFIVVTLGNRGGHPARSKRYHSYGYGNLRDYGLEDKKVVAEQLSYKHKFIDINKVGIFGHSGGGFMSTAAMLVYPDFFKVAVSSSGNHENAVYNRWWSEKHHGVKEITDDDGKTTFKYMIDDNPSIAKNLKGKLMITTGDIDNNVHPAGTILMANALIKANKRFDFFNFPGQRHGYGSMNEYFFWLKADYFSKHLMGDNTDHGVDIEEMNNETPQKN